MGNAVRRVVGKLASFRADQLTRDFIKHNFRLFPRESRGGAEVLFELNWLHSSHIACSYFANVLASKYGARILAYAPTRPTSFWRNVEWKLSQLLSLRDFAVYRSFGTCGFIRPELNQTQTKVAKGLANQILSELKTKSDIESIRVDEIVLGDLIYDSYLRTYNRATIEIADEEFKKFLLSSIELYVYWRDYFEAHDVRAVNASHSVYILAIPLRIALSKNIPAFVVGAIHAYRLSKENVIDSCDFLDYRKVFSTLPIEVQVAGLEQAKQRIDLRFSGKVGVDMRYAIKSAYGAHKTERLLQESNRIKVLVATHCFFDSPHSYGNNIFPDFYEWLDFLGQLTLETDYDWYIKTHADYLEGTMQIIESFIEKYPKFHLLPADSSHHQIIAEGIDVALTCYGTIAFEYAALGIPVVNASVNNPHIAYNFNLHPKNIDEYRAILLRLDHIDLTIDKNEVYEYYFMKHIFDARDWLFENYDKMIDEVGGYSEQFTSKVYGVWMREWSNEKHFKLMAKVDSFVDSGKSRL